MPPKGWTKKNAQSTTTRSTAVRKVGRSQSAKTTATRSTGRSATRPTTRPKRSMSLVVVHGMVGTHKQGERVHHSLLGDPANVQRLVDLGAVKWVGRLDEDMEPVAVAPEEPDEDNEESDDEDEEIDAEPDDEESDEEESEDSSEADDESAPNETEADSKEPAKAQGSGTR